MTLSPAHQQPIEASPSACNVAQAAAEPCQARATEVVGTRLQDAAQEITRRAAELQTLSDSELERHIHDCGGQMLMAMARWERYGDFADRGDASRWLRLQNEAIAARSPTQVARMEREAGLA